MKKILILCSILIAGLDGFENVKPVVYFSDIEITPLKIGEDMLVSYEYTAPLEYSEIFTTFEFKINNNLITSFKRYPGFGFVSEFTIPGDMISEGESIIKLIADCYVYSTFTLIEMSSQKKEVINIESAIEENKSLAIPSSLAIVGDYGKVNYNAEQYEFLFEEKILSDALYKFDLSSLKFIYSLKDKDFEYEKIELIIYGTMDDFPRLLFDEDVGGYRFDLKIEKDDYYQILLNESFYVDNETLMISRASGDYFNFTNNIYISKTLRNNKKEFPFTINIYGAGVHSNTLVFNGIYEFVSNPLGLSSDSVVSISESEIDEKIMEDYKEW